MIASYFAMQFNRYKSMCYGLKEHGVYCLHTHNYFVWMHECESGYYADFRRKSTNESFTYYDETLFGIIRIVYNTLHSN